MSKYEITEKVVAQRSVRCYIPTPSDEEGSEGGNFYTATSDFDHVTIDYLGKVRLERIPTVVELLESAIREDTQRAEDYGSHGLGIYLSETDEEFRESVKDDVPFAVIEPNLKDLWMGTNGYAQENIKFITTYTLMRYSNLYTLFEGPYTLFNFSYYELEGLAALLKEFLPQDKETA